jgi:hypothetical protein
VVRGDSGYWLEGEYLRELGRGIGVGRDANSNGFSNDFCFLWDFLDLFFGIFRECKRENIIN